MGAPREYARAMTITLPVRIPKTTRKWLERKARQEDRTLAWIIRNLLHEAMAAEQAQQPKSA